MVLGTLITLSSASWLGVWLGFEVNILGFLPLLLSFSSRRIEGAVKYLLIQASGSGLLLVRSLISWFSTGTSFLNINRTTSIIVLILRLLLKIGVFPFYFWVPSVMNRTRWINCLLLMTWQKIAPLALLSHLRLRSVEFSVLVTIAVISILVGGILGINQVQLRRLIAYSSIAHGGWMTILTTLSVNTTKVYFLLYSLISWGLLSSLRRISQTTLLQSKSIEKSTLDHITIKIRLLSLGGIPPLIGFFAKVIAIQEILAAHITWVVIFAILGALMNLRYYLTLLFGLLVSYSSINNLATKPSLRRRAFIIFNLGGLLIFPLVLRLI